MTACLQTVLFHAHKSQEEIFLREMDGPFSSVHMEEGECICEVVVWRLPNPRVAGHGKVHCKLVLKACTGRWRDTLWRVGRTKADSNCNYCPPFCMHYLPFPTLESWNKVRITLLI